MKQELMEVPREGEKKKEKRKRRDESTDFSAARLKLKLAAVLGEDKSVESARYNTRVRGT